MRQEANNIFRDGLNMDLHPMTVPKSVLTDNLNGTFITYNGNELLLQNDLGNISVSNFPTNHKVIGLKEYGGVLYIVSLNDNTVDDESPYSFGYTEIGTYPSPNYDNDQNYNPFVYRPLHNLKNNVAFTDIDLNMDIEHPIEINIQRSYDNSVNLILIDNKNPIRCINSGFAVKPNGEFEIIERNGENDTNRYDPDNIDLETRLIKNTSKIVNIDLENVQSGGQLMGGNYTFYIKFGDADYNQTDIVAESGIVSVFKGNDGVPTTISGTLMNERTDKLIQLNIDKLDRSFSKIYVYYTREYSDLNGVLMTEAKVLVEPFDITTDTNQIIQITGFEQTDSISIEDLNIYYHTVNSAKTGVQLANRLFIGNINRSDSNILYNTLKDFTENNVNISIKDDVNLSPVSLNFTNGPEYYSTQNIYNSVGYWPGEMYRFGIVYILQDGSTTPVFFPKNYDFRKNEGEEVIRQDDPNGIVIMPEKEIYITESNTNYVNPIGLLFTIDSSNIQSLPQDVMGWFVVRQKRIPNKICQGLMIGIDRESKTPVIYNGQNKWLSQSFLSFDRENAAVDGNNYPTLLKYNNVQYNINTNETEISILSLEDWLERDHWVLNGKYDGIYEFYRNLPNRIFYYQWDEKILGDSSVDNSWLDQDELLEEAPNSSTNYDSSGNLILQLVDSNNNSVIKYQGNLFNPDSQTHYYNSYPFESPDSYHNNAARYEWPLIFVVSFTDEYNDLASWAAYINQKLNTQTVVEGIWVFKKDLNAFKEWLKGNSTYNYYTYNNDYCTFANNFITSSYQYYVDQQTNIGFDKKTISETVENLSSEALLSLDPSVNKEIQSIFDSSEYYLSSEYNTVFRLIDNTNPLIFTYDQNTLISSAEKTLKKHKMIYVGPNTNYKGIQEFGFSTVAGNANDVSSFKRFTKGCWLWYNGDSPDSTLKYKEDVYKNGSIEGEDGYSTGGYNEGIYKYNTGGNINLIRGKFAPFIGIDSKEELMENIGAGKIYTVLKEPFNSNTIENQFLIRKQDSTEFYCVSTRNKIDRNISNNTNSISVFRGDCYTNTIGIRMIRNFSDPDVPLAENILDELGWRKYVIARGVNEIDDDTRIRYDLVNRADVNTVDLGYWVVFKCLSSQNLGIRSIDEQHLDEIALTGTVRSFFPLNGADTSTGNKLEESFIANAGYNTSVGRKRYDKYNNVPYIKSSFSDRIMFSNVDVIDYFSNGYRTFQGVSYHDYDTKYGEITKLLSWKNNLFCVFEHGLALLPINEKALIQTTTDQNVHIYGHGVLSDTMTIISEDFGSKWPESVIRTPIGIYGIDHSEKKIWRFSDKGLETIADMKMQSFLNKYIVIDGNDCLPDVMLKNIKTHYNARKGDVMFVLYKGDPRTPEKDQTFNICFNERQNLWVTRYDWIPSYSDNIDNDFYSIDQKQSGLYKHSIDAQPCYWYTDQHGFEFEFAVNEPLGIHKIFDDLQIISNNTQPEGLEITILGDDYQFKREVVDENKRDPELPEYLNADPKTTSELRNNLQGNLPDNINIKSVDLTDTLQQKCIVKTQNLKDLHKYGRLRGNIQYKEGTWYANIEPIVLNKDTFAHKSMRIRDKWAKIRIRYSGEKLAVISAIKTLFTISYA